MSRTLAKPAPGADEHLAVRIERGLALPEPAYEAATLDDVTTWLAALNRPGFTPATAGWTPTTRSTTVNSSEWSVEAPSRGLPAEDSAEGAHANVSGTLPPV